MQEAVIREIQQLRLLMGSARDPRGRVFAQLADALRRNGELEEAWELVRQGVDGDPHFVPGHLVKGWVLQERGELDEALAAYRRAVELDPDNPFGLHGVGALLRARGDESGAELLDRALELHPAVAAAAPVAPRALVPLHELPFLPLADLAPDGVAVATAPPAGGAADLHPDADLPFVSLAELAPGPPEDGAGREDAVDAVGEDADLPFMSLAELAPDGDGDGAEDPGDATADDGVPTPAASAAAPDGDGAAPPEEETVEPAAAADEEGDATPATRTMAELLVSQNQVERAVAIYEEILARDPENRDIADRIEELREDLHPELSRAGEPLESGPSPFTWHEDDDAEGRDGDEGSPEEGQGAHHPGSAGDAGQTAATYFGDLLSFSPRREGGGGGSAGAGPGADAATGNDREDDGEGASGNDR